MKVEIKGLEEKEFNPQKFGGMCSRATVELKRESEIDFEKGIDTVATTDAPVLVVDWEKWRIIREVLPMQYMEAPDDDDATLLDTHDRSSIKKIMGSARNWNKDEHNSYSKLFISEAEPDVRQKIKEGHIKRVSIGYETDSGKTVEIPKGKEVIIDGTTFKNEAQDDYPFVVRLWWKVKELSLVPIPADKAAKFRAELDEKIKLMEQQNTAELEELRSQLNEHENTIKELNIKLNKRSPKMDNEKELTPDELVNQELDRREEIKAIASQVRNGYKDGEKELNKVTEKALSEKWGAEKFRAFVWERFDFEKPVGTAATELDLSPKDVKRYSVLRAINHLLKPGDKHARNEASYEIECSHEIEQRLGRTATGLFIPNDIQKKAFGQRDLTAGGVGTGSQLVGTDHLGGSFIELLRNKMLAARLGARTLSGLQGNISIPKWTGASTAIWISTEGGDATESTPTTGSLALSAKDLGASVDISRRLMLQSDPSVEALVLEDIATVLAIAIDKAVFHGTGADGQPTGIALTSGIGGVTGASFGWGSAVEFESDVDTGNALEGSFAYVTTPAIKGLLKTRVKESGYPVYLCDGANLMNGYPVYSTNQITAGYMFFGNFAQIIIAEWGVLDLYPTKIERSGTVILTGLKTIDIGVRQPGAFSMASSIT